MPCRARTISMRPRASAGIRRLPRTGYRSISERGADRENRNRQLRLRYPVGLLHSAEGIVNSALGQLFKVPAALLETGLITVHTALGTAQRGLEKVAGQKRFPRQALRVDGPTDVDLAVSDFANRVARIARYTFRGRFRGVPGLGRNCRRSQAGFRIRKSVGSAKCRIPGATSPFRRQPRRTIGAPRTRYLRILRALQNTVTGQRRIRDVYRAPGVYRP